MKEIIYYQWLVVFLVLAVAILTIEYIRLRRKSKKGNSYSKYNGNW